MTKPIVVQYTLTGEMSANADAQFSRITEPPLHWGCSVALWIGVTAIAYAILYLRITDRFLGAGMAVMISSIVALIALLKKPEVEAKPGFQNLALLYEFTEKGMEKTTAAMQLKVEWVACAGYLETDGYFFIKDANGLVHVIPKFPLYTEDLESLRSILSAKVAKLKTQPKPHSRFKQGIAVLIIAIVIGACVCLYRLSGR